MLGAGHGSRDICLVVARLLAEKARASVYYREGVPPSTQEAMAMGRAVITTDTPGCRETVVEGRNGFLAPVRDAEALATVMRRFIEDPLLIVNVQKASAVILAAMMAS